VVIARRHSIPHYPACVISASGISPASTQGAVDCLANVNQITPFLTILQLLKGKLIARSGVISPALMHRVQGDDVFTYQP